MAELIPSLPPRLVTLLAQIKNGDSHAQDVFWMEIKSSCPIVKSIPTDAAHCHVTFFWRGNADTNRVAMLGGLPSGFLSTPLRHLDGTDIWYLTQTYPTDARFAYVYQINGPEQLPWTDQALMDAFGRRAGQCAQIHRHPNCDEK